MTEIFRHYA